MRSIMLTSLTVLAFATLAAPAVAVTLDGDCETTDSCGGGGGPPPPPQLSGTGTVGGLYKVFTYDGSDLRYGFVQDGMTGYSGGGPFHAIGGDGTVTDGYWGSNVSLRATTAPADPSVLTTAAAADGTSASSALSNGYLVELHARNSAAFTALESLLTTSGAIATIHGHYTLATTGQAYAIASVATGAGDGEGDFTIGGSLERGISSICDLSGYYDTTGAGCGTAYYNLDLSFVTGSTFTNGDPLSIYGTIILSTGVHAGSTGLGGVAGTASAFIDPTITLNPLFNNPLYSLNVGNAITPYVGAGAVPEPASWAMMVVGFGLTGRAARRAARKLVLA